MLRDHEAGQEAGALGLLAPVKQVGRVELLHRCRVADRRHAHMVKATPRTAVRCVSMDLELFVTPGLGDASYLLASGREAVLVDPQRDAWRFVAPAAGRGWRDP